MEPGGDTPAIIFGQLLERGFTDRAELQRALEEFAHIEECEWAREMLQSFRDDE
jgi:SOS response regulatory protein OraA/RecX